MRARRGVDLNVQFERRTQQAPAADGAGDALRQRCCRRRGVRLCIGDQLAHRIAAGVDLARHQVEVGAGIRGRVVAQVGDQHRHRRQRRVQRVRGTGGEGGHGQHAFVAQAALALGRERGALRRQVVATRVPNKPTAPALIRKFTHMPNRCRSNSPCTCGSGACPNHNGL